MASTTTYQCSQCSREFGFEKIRYSSEKQIFCADCYAQAQESQAEKKGTRSASGSAHPVGKGASDPTRYICVNCRYKFNVKKASEMSARCPYCGKDNLMEYEGTVNRILDEVSQIPGERFF
ncbi:hypothetical protein HY491_02035 [Candidatus Woesearchaeota archaeon]|nr:hypothetical protein [Candidatus Woesearchaeota archaeon]